MMLVGDLDYTQSGKITEEENTRSDSSHEDERDPSLSPPPKLPELKGLGKDDHGQAAGFFGGGDIFRNIK